MPFLCINTPILTCLTVWGASETFKLVLLSPETRRIWNSLCDVIDYGYVVRHDETKFDPHSCGSLPL